MTTPRTPHLQATGWGHAACVETNGRTFYVAHGRRLTIGSAKTCDLVLQGPGIAPKHARLSLRADGRILAKPLHGETLRIGLERVQQPVVIEPGQVLGIGLTVLRTGQVRNDFYVQLRLGIVDLRRSLRRAIDRAPWFLMSAVFHAALLMLLLLLWSGNGGDGERGGQMLLVREDGDSDAVLADPLVEATTEVREPEVPDAELPEDSAKESEEEEVFVEPVTGVGAEGLSEESPDTLFHDLGKGRQKGKAALPEGVSRGFVRTITKLRKSGLEIAFLFDSTASMGRFLDDAKADLLEIFLLVEELVPTTRMALLTYRDRGDEYITRQTRLGIAHFEALAFLGSVRADGGGDFEEAVDVALEKATKLRWRPGARKVVVIAGDAPPHRGRQLGRALQYARRLTRQNGQVHCLVVGNENATWQTMRRIARAGRGRCLPREEHRQLALQLLVLALGPESDRDLRKLLERGAKQRARRRKGPLTRTLPSPRILASTLGRVEPDRLIVEAWSWAEPADLAALARLLRDRRLSREGLHALYYLSNRCLERQGRPPIEPHQGRALQRGVPAELHRRLSRPPDAPRVRQGRRRR